MEVSRVHDVCMYVCAYTSIYAFSLVIRTYIISVICIHNTTHIIYSFMCTYIRTSPASSPARWRCSTTLANSPDFASQLERWMEACAWRQPSMSLSRCTLYNHHHYHHILQLPLLPPLACVVTTILLLPLPPRWLSTILFNDVSKDLKSLTEFLDFSLRQGSCVQNNVCMYVWIITSFHIVLGTTSLQ
jgi:hypothetical protein